jgi:hypothetical protein
VGVNRGYPGYPRGILGVDPNTSQAGQGYTRVRQGVVRGYSGGGPHPRRGYLVQAGGNRGGDRGA